MSIFSKKLYVCDHAKLISLLPGSWSVIDDDFNATSWNALDVLIKVQRNLSQSALLNMYVSEDIKHSDQNVVMVRAGDF